MVAAHDAFHIALDDVLLASRALLKRAAHAPAASFQGDIEHKIEELLAAAQQLRDTVRARRGDNDQQPSTHTAVVPQAKRFDPLQPALVFSQGTAASSANTTSTSQPSVWSGFYNKTLRERMDVLSLMYPRLQRVRQDAAEAAATDDKPFLPDATGRLGELPVRSANLMIENCIGVLGIPLGLGLNFVVDGKHISVPMAVEEPSVVAAASSAAKLVAAFGNGFATSTTGNIMTSQVQLVDTPDIPYAIAAVALHRERLLHMANTTLCPNMKKRGGGAVDVYCRIVTQRARSQHTHKTSDTFWYTPCDDELAIDASASDVEYLVVHIDVDVCEAMGANIVNTVAEGLSTEICQLTKSRCGLRILTNLCMQRRTRSVFEIPVQKLGWKGVDGEQVALRIVEAYNFAAIDPYRAVTNNKGIMNGIDAVALATGQDWRAIEAAAHCYASRSGQYASLSKYEIVDRPSDGVKVLRGSLEMPISVGSKGGALLTHPGYRATHSILGQPDAKGLASLIVSIGLAQNFAAIRAIAITGIQKGHMALHARNIAVAAGAPSELVSEVCTYMLGRKSINIETAQEYLHAHEVFSEIHHSSSPPLSPQSSTPQAEPPLPSMFYVEIPVPHLEGTISLNIAFQSLNKHPQYIAIQPTSAKSDAATLPLIHRQLLGDKGYNQLEKMFLFLASMRSIVIADIGDQDESTPILSRANIALQNKLQLLSVVINILVSRLLEVRSHVAGAFMRDVLASGASLIDWDGAKCHALLQDVPASDDVLSTGLPLFLALCQVLKYHLEQDVAHALIRERMATEQWELLRAVVDNFALLADGVPTRQLEAANDQELLEAYMVTHAKRWQATMLLLVDALALATEHVTPARLDTLRCIGEYMECEGTIAHDLARYRRAVTERLPNAFVHWMRCHGHAVDDEDADESLVAAFREATDAYAARKWRCIEQAMAASEAPAVFSLAAVKRVAQLVWDVYAARSGKSPRKDSF
jgi:hydroxymethylglutaryl-CoA reductase